MVWSGASMFFAFERAKNPLEAINYIRVSTEIFLFYSQLKASAPFYWLSKMINQINPSPFHSVQSIRHGILIFITVKPPLICRECRLAMILSSLFISKFCFLKCTFWMQLRLRGSPNLHWVKRSVISENSQFLVQI